MQMFKSALAIFRKDLQLELRTRYAFNTVLTFVAAATMVMFFSLNTSLLTADLYSGLLWIIILFAALSSLARSFVMETDQQTFDLLRLNTPGLPVYTGKLLFNFSFTYTVSLLTALLFAILTGSFETDLLPFMLLLLLGSLGFSSVATLMASLVSRSVQKGAIFSVLCLPLLLPLIVLLSDATRELLGGAPFTGIAEQTAALVGYCGVTITLSIMLFDYVWTD
ncbi:heme exporter protein B [Cyclonatronum proteinivorum]|uniref:Heme exporter protein B n=1 Tax=Cyclonatronum proteinivorum TaxID=1457365 RepID=A0A345UMC5_9BACT|nr:heme exporter protein CcmB [Cyclonatronum proteinivorum]AXJ01627.1 heme exporter protein B [Cyclonatronum proteinivorum]